MLPADVDPPNLSMGWLDTEKFGAPGEKNPRMTTITLVLAGHVTNVCEYIPTGGLYDFLTRGRKKVNTPSFGAVAIFKRGPDTVHAAITLGKSSSGQVYVLQRLNFREPIVITTLNDPVLAGYPNPPLYYAK